VRVQVSRVDLDSRKIDFRIVREGQGPLGEATGRSKRRGGPRDGARDSGEGFESAQAQLAEVQRRDREVKRGGKSAGRGSKKGAAPSLRAEQRAQQGGAKPAGKKAPSRKSVRRRS
jgi:ribonuclease R